MSQITRRDFVGKSVAGAAGLAAVASWPAVGRAAAANEKVVLALIGAGGRGQDLMRQMAARPDAACKYVCDAEEPRGAAFAKEVEKIQGSPAKHVKDMREALDDKGLDAVVVATPEQWHALATIWACQAGKDVYVEKCISRKVEEGRKMVEAAQKHKRVVQAGTQSRTSAYVASARQYIQEGKLGKVFLVKVFFMQPNLVYGGYPIQKQPDSGPPQGLDWDLWLGPAPEKPYSPHRHRQWYGYWDYSGGNLSDAIHSLDVARAAIGDPPHPKAVNCYGGRWQYDDGGEMPDCQIVTYEFDKLAMTLQQTGFSKYTTKEVPEVRYGDKFPHWPLDACHVEIYGTEQLMYLGRHGSGWQAVVAGGEVVAGQPGRWGDPTAIEDFIDCIRTRREPKANILQGHLSACLEHLANIAYRTGNQKLVFDGQAEKFVGNDQANQQLKAAGRKQYRIPDEV
jgi:predicted dehydrogenase